MKVRATKNGFYGRYLSEGDVFEVPDGSKASWFEPLKLARKARTEGEQPPEGGSDTDPNAPLA